MTVCKHCGNNASPEAIFCIRCGSKLGTSRESDAGLFGSIRHLLRGSMADEEIKA